MIQSSFSRHILGTSLGLIVTSLLITSGSAQSAELVQKTIEEKASGLVKELKVIPYKDNDFPGGVHVTLQTESGIKEVYLGMRWLQDNRNTTIKSGDRVMVVGVSFALEDLKGIFAKNLKKVSDTGSVGILGN